jgi:hypothetical protein
MSDFYYVAVRNGALINPDCRYETFHDACEAMRKLEKKFPKLKDQLCVTGQLDNIIVASQILFLGVKK